VVFFHVLKIHGMNLDVVSLFVHKLAQQCRDIVVTDRFLYVTDIDGKSLSVVSCQLSESRICSDAVSNLHCVFLVNFTLHVSFIC
jgi:hypothetical protein